MKNNKISYVASFIILIIIIIYACTFSVGVRQVAISSSLGKDKIYDKAGLYFRWPAPFQKISYQDKAILSLENNLSENQTKDNYFLLNQFFINYKIVDHLLFYEKVGDVKKAKEDIIALMSDIQRELISQSLKEDLYGKDAEGKWKFYKFLDEFKIKLDDKLKMLGMEVLVVGLKKSIQHPDNMQSTLKLIKDEILAQQDALKNKTEQDINKLKHESNKEASLKLQEAKNKLEELEGELFIKGINDNALSKEDRDFILFLSKLESLKKLLEKNATLVIDENFPIVSPLYEK